VDVRGGEVVTESERVWGNASVSMSRARCEDIARGKYALSLDIVQRLGLTGKFASLPVRACIVELQSDLRAHARWLSD
jgi:hypothetical protein